MHDHVDDNGAEERSFELLSFLELFGLDGSPFPAPEAGWQPVRLKLTIPDVPDLYSRQHATAEYRRTSQRFSVAGRRAARRRRCRPAGSAFRIVEPPLG